MLDTVRAAAHWEAYATRKAKCRHANSPDPENTSGAVREHITIKVTLLGCVITCRKKNHVVDVWCSLGIHHGFKA